MSPWPSITIRNCLTDDALNDVSDNCILPQDRPKSLRPAREAFRTSEGINDRQDWRRLRRPHRAFRIARRAAVRPGSIAKYRQSFQVQVVLADALVRFARASRAKDNFAGHVRQVIQSDRQPALHRNEIDHVHDGVNLRQAFSRDHPPQQRFRRTPVSRRILSQRFVRRACGHNLRRLQHAARERQFLNFHLSRFHLLEQRVRRRARRHLRRQASQRCPWALRFQFRINSYIHRGLSLQPVSAEPRSAAGISPGGLFRSPGSAPVCAKRPESLPRRTRCGSVCTPAAASPAAPGPFSRARRTSAFRFPPTQSRLPGKSRSPAPPPETPPAENAAGMPWHQCRLHVRLAAARWARLHSPCDYRGTPSMPSGISDTPPPSLPFILRRSLPGRAPPARRDRKSTRLNSSHQIISYAVFCLKKKK